jgi:hypothetical protein
MSAVAELPRLKSRRSSKEEAQERRAQLVDATRARDRAFVDAPGDWEKAAEIARSIDEPWFRCQALGATARWAPATTVAALAWEACACAEASENSYDIAAAAWPLRALIERGRAGVARELCRKALAKVPSVLPASSRSEAAFHILEAILLDTPARSLAVEALVTGSAPFRGWRVGRNFRDAVLMLAGVDKLEAQGLLARVPESIYRRQAVRGLAQGESRAPHAFFG